MLWEGCSDETQSEPDRHVPGVGGVRGAVRTAARRCGYYITHVNKYIKAIVAIMIFNNTKNMPAHANAVLLRFRPMTPKITDNIFVIIATGTIIINNVIYTRLSADP